MNTFGPRNPKADLSYCGIQKPSKAYWNLTPEELDEHAICKKQAVLSDTGALVVYTGKFTGRAPKDRFIVKDELTRESVDWNDINQPFEPAAFDKLAQKVAAYFDDKEIYVRDVAACAEEKYRLNIRVISEYPWISHFTNNMFLRLSKEEILNFEPEWTILNAPEFLANPEEDGTPHENFAIINFSRKLIIIGGTGYTGEVKKGIFSVLNFLLPHQKNVLSMHCSANMGSKGDTAIFFGLSGTGKTTLSADPHRQLIGDDEHGWWDEGVFNFEGGCYAKVIDLSEEKEPDIYRAIRHGAILENITFFEGSRKPNYEDSSITPNTRVSYPLEHIANARIPSVGGHPKNIFFLTYDAFGVLPPLARLTKAQAMYHFISGYTAKVAGTEEGVTEPQTVFSSCFGAPFLPLPPTTYARMLGERIEKHGAKVWLINTGLTAGPYGEGYRMKLKHTRALIQAVLEGKLEQVEWDTVGPFRLQIPRSCPNVPQEILNPRNTWKDTAAYDRQAAKLAKAFVENFHQFEHLADEELKNAAPLIGVAL
ncbi:MAG TPA: phosphoenolpyruvate carboxykinase (ATP) [Phaeodactylibacter sp.]|nr:phosphoenolpyruvate carboxykinase (ATP) [Phaeodactylibacter sp.]